VFEGWKEIDIVMRKEEFDEDQDEDIDVFDVKVN